MSDPLPGYDPSNPPPARLTPAQAAVVEAELAAAQEDTDSLVPAILAVLAAYLAYRAAKGRITGTWQAWTKALRLTELAGEAMAAVARRAVGRQMGRSSPRHAEDLLPYADNAVAVSTDTQLRTLVSALQHYQRTGAVPAGLAEEDLDFQVGTKPPGQRPQDYRAPKPKPTLPDNTEPPVLLAELVANAGRNSAQLEQEVELARAKGKGSVWKTWIDVSDSHVRASHQFLGSGKYEFHSVPITQPFRSIFGHEMNFPGDASLGAPLSELANCRCTLTFSNKSQLNPDEPSYLPAFWIHKQKGDAPHDEMAYRAELQKRYDDIMARKQAAWAANPKLAHEMALEQAKQSLETKAQTEARHIAEAAAKGITYVPSKTPPWRP